MISEQLLKKWPMCWANSIEIMIVKMGQCTEQRYLKYIKRIKFLLTVLPISLEASVCDKTKFQEVWHFENALLRLSPNLIQINANERAEMRYYIKSYQTIPQLVLLPLSDPGLGVLFAISLSRFIANLFWKSFSILSDSF